MRQLPKRGSANFKGLSKLNISIPLPIPRLKHNNVLKYAFLQDDLGSINHSLPEFIEKCHPPVFKGI